HGAWIPAQRHTRFRLQLGASAEARIAPWRAFERQVIVLRRVGNAEVETDDIEERHGRQSNALRAIKAGDLKNRDVAAGREGLRYFRRIQNPVRADAALGDKRELPAGIDRVEFALHPRRDNTPRHVDDMDRYARHGSRSSPHLPREAG